MQSHTVIHLPDLTIVYGLLPTHWPPLNALPCSILRKKVTTTGMSLLNLPLYQSEQLTLTLIPTDMRYPKLLSLWYSKSFGIRYIRQDVGR